jgi:Rer1 family
LTNSRPCPSISSQKEKSKIKDPWKTLPPPPLPRQPLPPPPQTPISLPPSGRYSPPSRAATSATPFVRERWLGFGCLVLVYLLRVWLLEGFYIVTYALGIYSLGQLVAFLSPMVDPEIQELIDGSSPSLPTRSTDEFRPFVRRLPEFKFWYILISSFKVI